MSAVEVDHEYEGLDLYGRAIIFLPRTSIYFSDLRNVALENLDLSGSHFVGCRINGTSFRCSNLSGTRFHACFSSDSGSPTDFTGCTLDGVEFIDCQINCVGFSGQERLRSWPSMLTESTSLALDDLHNIRYRGVVELRQMADCRSVPVLACVLIDDEWEVKTEAIRGISEMFYGLSPAWMRPIMNLIFLQLGTENSVLRDAAIEQLAIMKPPSSVLSRVVSRVTDEDDDVKLIGLRAGFALCKLDDCYASLVPLDAVEFALKSEQIDVRIAAVRLLGILGDPGKALQDMLADVSDEVRCCVQDVMIWMP